MDLAEKERLRLEKHRLHQKKYREKRPKQADRAKAPHPVPVHMNWEMRERLDYLVAVYKPPAGISGFMRQAFEFYAAHLLGTGTPEPRIDPVPAAEEPRIDPVTETRIDPAETGIDPAPEVKEEPRIDPPEVRIEVSVDPSKPTEQPYRWRYDLNDPSTWVPPKAKALSRKEKIAKTLIDAEKRVPVRIEFTRKHHHIPWGMRHIMWDNGLQHRKNVWRGRLHPDYAETLRDQVAKFGGTLEITGGLGDAPKWAPGEYRDGARKKKEETASD